MLLAPLVESARRRQASDLHLEPGLPPAFRVRGALEFGDAPIAGRALLDMAREIVGDASWPEFLARRSFDASRVVAGTRVRVNVLQSARGVGLAVRLLGQTQPSIERLNLHPEVGELVRHRHGLVLVSGATGSGKSSTLAALIERINGTEARHVLTIEAPIEHVFRPRRAFIRQREVGRDTPSFEQALIDALREDPDVVVVGEMRDPETMRLTLAAAETGHLVLATLHAATPAEAVTRIVSAFSAEGQAGVQAQLAACLRAIVCQRLAFSSVAQRLVPELEICIANDAIRNHIREGHAHRIQTAMETGAGEGQWTLPRYRRWLAERRTFHTGAGDPPPDEPEQLTGSAALLALAAIAEPSGAGSVFGRAATIDEPEAPAVAIPPMPRTAARPASAPTSAQPATVVIDDDGLGLDDLIRQIERRR